jgi:hypothetical protein
MNNLSHVMMGFLVAIGLAGSASAYKLSPAGTKFTLSGSAGVVINGQFKGCSITMTGKTARHGQQSEILTFSDNGTCGAVGTNLPWKVHAREATMAVINNFAYTIPNNVCAPKNVQVLVLSSGEWDFRTRVEGPDGPCVMSADLQSNPTVTIVP